MNQSIRFVGLDVHSETIAAAVAEPSGEVRSLGTIPNRPESIRKLLKTLGSAKEELRVCYEAGPCGYVLYWILTKLGVHCDVVAPTLIPKMPGDRVKTDRRDALKLARSYRSGDLTPVWVPDEAHEALRDLVRAREAAKKDQLVARHRLGKFLLRHGLRRPEKTGAWTGKHMVWLRALKFELFALEETFRDYLSEVDHVTERIAKLDRAIDVAIEKAPDKIRAVVDALQALRGIAKLSAVSVVAELGEISRFGSPRQLMGYSGAVPSEHSSGGPGKAKRGGITKTGNAHLRRIVGEASWSYRMRPSVQGVLKRRQEGLSEEVKAIAWKAQNRLNLKYRRLSGRGIPKQKVVTAVARELLGFIWAIAVHTERQAS